MNKYLKNWVRVAEGIGLMVIMFPIGIVKALVDGIFGTEDQFTFTFNKSEEK